MPDPRLFPMAVTTDTTLGNHTGTWRAYRPIYAQHTPPCREACPAGEDTARWIDLLRGRSFQDAWQTLTEDNPFPATMGRICVHPCQSACNRQHHDEALGINSLEQFLGDRALQEGWAFAPPPGERAERVAVVGGGPAGLSYAYQLRRLGYQVTIYDAADRLGGNLTQALPDDQLPLRVVEQEIQRILDLGVQVRYGARVGAEVAWADLRAEYQAVFIAPGAPLIPGPGWFNQDLPGVTDGLSLLRMAKAGSIQIAARRIVVVGAGLTGMEAARTLARLGAEVTIVTAEADDSLMLPERMREVQEDGVTLICGADVRSVTSEDGVLTGVELADRTVPADTVVWATGRIVDLEHLPDDAEVDASTLHLSADPFTGETAMTGIFAGGDVTGTRYAVEAVGAGKRAAAATHAYLQGLNPQQALAPARLGHSPNLSMRYYLNPQAYPPQVQVKLQRVVAYEDIETVYFDRRPRVVRPQGTAADPGGDTERRQGLTEEQALAESQRCFSCGTCIGCGNCLIFCPDMAISKTADGAGFHINWDYCKGCGVCVNECPREALVLEEEVK